MQALIGLFILAGIAALSRLAAPWLSGVPGLGLVPPAVLGMALLVLACFMLGRVPGPVKEGARLLLRIFPLLFIPALVSVVGEAEILSGVWPVLIFAITGSTLMGLMGAAFAFRLFVRRAGR